MAKTQRTPTALAAAGRSLLITPEAVKDGRDFAAARLTRYAAVHDLAGVDQVHIDDVKVCVSELVTNAIKYGSGPDRTNINLEISIWPRWTRVTVDDRDPEVPNAVPVAEEMAESGRGLMIVSLYAARFWWGKGLISKTANAAILHTGVTLTDEDEIALDLEMVR
ncbi:MAG: ATP-binding protein [Actinoallomurus sp.]